MLDPLTPLTPKAWMMTRIGTTIPSTICPYSSNPHPLPPEEDHLGGTGPLTKETKAKKEGRKVKVRQRQ